MMNKPADCRIATLLRKRWFRTLSLIACLAIVVGLYLSTYQEQRTVVQEVKSVTERAIEIDEQLRNDCQYATISSDLCYQKKRDLYQLTLEQAPTTVIRLAYAWQEYIDFQNCKGDRDCITDTAWGSAIGDPNFDPKYYAANPDKFRQYLQRQLNNSQSAIRSEQNADR